MKWSGTSDWLSVAGATNYTAQARRGEGHLEPAGLQRRNLCL